jgi:PAS domain S-box-containing protein
MAALHEQCFYRRVFEYASVAMIATDAEHKIVLWNDSAGKLLEKAHEDMVGRPLAEAVPRHRQSLFRRLLKRASERRETMQFEVRVPTGHLKDRLARSEKMAALGTLAGGVAHHFNNILGGLATAVDFALTSGDPAEARQALRLAAGAAERASRITQSLTLFAEHDPDEAERTDLTEIVMDFARPARQRLSPAGIRVETDIERVPVLRLDENRIRTILQHLLSNAEDAMPDGGTVTFTLDRDDRSLVLIVSDTGCGIPSENLGMVFQPFFTTKGAMAGGQGQNPGLGLAVVHGLMTDLGGQIQVDSEPDMGTAFTLIFPLPNSAQETGNERVE